MKLLHVDSSILSTNSTSRLLTAEIVAAWKAAHPDTTVEYLDLAVNTPPHFSADALGIKTGVQAQPTEAQQRENELSEKLVSQFLASDVIVVGAPLYRTFKYTDKGPVGLAGGKTVIVASSRGGIYSTTEGGRAMEHQESYLKAILGFFGVTDVRFVRAEGLAMGDAPKAAALAAARADILTATAEAANQKDVAQAA